MAGFLRNWSIVRRVLKEWWEAHRSASMAPSSSHVSDHGGYRQWQSCRWQCDDSAPARERIRAPFMSSGDAKDSCEPSRPSQAGTAVMFTVSQSTGIDGRFRCHCCCGLFHAQCSSGASSSEPFMWSSAAPPLRLIRVSGREYVLIVSHDAGLRQRLGDDEGRAALREPHARDRRPLRQRR